MSISHTDRAPFSDQSPAVQELEQRLREQAERNAQLDTEVRYLLQELAIRKEFIAQLEAELDSAHAAAGEFAAYRARISYRIVDRLATWVHRLPWLYRPLKRLGRIAAVSVNGSKGQKAPPSSSVQKPLGDEEGAEPPVAYNRQKK